MASFQNPFASNPALLADVSRRSQLDVQRTQSLLQQTADQMKEDYRRTMHDNAVLRQEAAREGGARRAEARQLRMDREQVAKDAFMKQMTLRSQSRADAQLGLSFRAAERADAGLAMRQEEARRAEARQLRMGREQAAKEAEIQNLTGLPGTVFNELSTAAKTGLVGAGMLERGMDAIESGEDLASHGQLDAGTSMIGAGMAQFERANILLGTGDPKGEPKKYDSGTPLQQARLSQSVASAMSTDWTAGAVEEYVGRNGGGYRLDKNALSTRADEFTGVLRNFDEMSRREVSPAEAAEALSQLESVYGHWGGHRKYVDDVAKPEELEQIDGLYTSVDQYKKQIELRLRAKTVVTPEDRTARGLGGNSLAPIMGNQPSF